MSENQPTGFAPRASERARIAAQSGNAHPAIPGGDRRSRAAIDISDRLSDDIGAGLLQAPPGMRVKEVMRQAWGLDSDATLDEVAEAIQTTGCEALLIVDSPNGDVVVRQLVALRDLPKLRRIGSSAARGHAVGRSALDLLGALGRDPGRFPIIEPEATLADAWGAMSEECVPHLAVVENREVVGMISLVVTFSEFPHRSPAAGFWA